VRAVLHIALVLIAMFTIVTAQMVMWPSRGAPAKVSAIVMLAGEDTRLPVALQLADEHRAPVLVVSQGYDGYGGPCPPRPPGVQLICFDPVPATTRGEAEYFGQLAKKYHWTSVIVVTSRPQALRAYLLFMRCFPGAVYNVAAPIPLLSWPEGLAYEWGALAKAAVSHVSC
jgi:uncharacterized SAM-binding protein YcdF (DUF218 family)